jgi:cytochrome b pre-mRNA-processing protein 3
MLGWLNRRAPVTRKAGELYGGVVTAARNPGFYGPGRVADTPEGRFELVALHLFLVAERAKALPGGEALAQALIEALITDMDDCMREMGVGDLTVPKKVKRAAAGFYERSGDYRAALARAKPTPPQPDPLADVIARVMLASPDEHNFANDVADYMRASHQLLAATSAAKFETGKISFAALPATTGSHS